MKDKRYQQEVLHEIAMSIGNSLNLVEMLRSCIPVFMRRLDCTLASVVQRGPAPEAVFTLPRNAVQHGLYHNLQTLLGGPDLPQKGGSQLLAGRHFHIWPLDEAGWLVLARSEPFEYALQQELAPLADKLAVAIHACRQHALLREVRNEQIENERRWKLALEGAGHGVWDWDPASGRVFKSHSWKALLGYRDDEVGDTREDWDSRVHPDDLPECLAQLKMHLEGDAPVYRSIYRMRRADDSYTWVSDQGMVFGRDPDGRPLRVVGTITDISERKALEQALIEARDTAEAANKMKSQFLANMSHEIRTPLNGVIGMTQLALDSRPTEEQRGYLNMARSAAEHLLTVINDILDYSKIEAGKLELVQEPFALREMLEQTLQLLQFSAAEKGLVISLQVAPALPDRVVADAHRIRQVLLNLAGNAIKFTHVGHVNIRVDAAQCEPQQVHVVVEDSGIGIPADKVTAIFEAFSQADGSITRKFGGSGLGLSISRRLVEMMGGTLWVESEEGKGSRFHFSFGSEVGTVSVLPVAPEPAPEASPVSARAGRYRILVAEDNPVNQVLARKFLERMGHEVEIVPDGAEAVRALERGHFDLVLMDVMMPVMGGIEATLEVRAREQLAGKGHVPIVALTANAMSGDRKRYLEAGMDDYLAKPYRLDELERVLQRWLSQARVTAQQITKTQGGAGMVFDEDLMLSRLGDDPILARELVAISMEGMVPELAELENELAAGQTEAVARAAHTLKGMAAQAGGMRLAALCQEVELCCKRGEPISDACLADLKREQDALLAELVAWCQRDA